MLTKKFELNLEDGSNPIHMLVEQLTVKVVEEQDRLIMTQIREIGGTTYRDITVDKSKVIEAFDKQTPKLVMPKGIRKSGVQTYKEYHCPRCDQYLPGVILKKYCDECGQALSWDVEGEENEG